MGAVGKSGRPRARRFAAAMVSIAAVASVLAYPSAAGAVPLPWKNCGSPGDVISVQQMDASVWPPVHGQPLTLSYKLVVGQAIPGGTEALQITLPSGHVIRFSMPFQPPPPLTGFPVPVGPLNDTVTFTVPRWLRPGATYGLQIDATSTAGPRLICFDVQIPIK